MGKVIDDSNLGYFYSKLKSIFFKKTDIDSVPTANSTNLVTSGSIYNTLDDNPKYRRVSVTTSGTIDLNTHEVAEFDVADGLTITFNVTVVSGKLNYYHWIVNTSTTPPNIAWPLIIDSWAKGSAPIIAGNKRYEVGILSGVATVIETDIQTVTSGE